MDAHPGEQLAPADVPVARPLVPAERDAFGELFQIPAQGTVVGVIGREGGVARLQGCFEERHAARRYVSKFSVARGTPRRQHSTAPSLKELFHNRALRGTDLKNMRLDGKVAVITGGAGGIGQGAAKRFAAEGANVLIVDLAEEALDDALRTIGSNRVSACAADVTQAKDNERMFEVATERYGGVDIFLANAGIEGAVAPIVDSHEEDFDRVIAVNVKGVWLGLKSAIPALAARGGGQHRDHVERRRPLRNARDRALRCQQARRHRPDARRSA